MSTAPSTWNPAGQIGVANGAWSPGTLIQTGTAGPSNTSQYTDGTGSPLPIYDQNGNLIPPGTTLAPGTYISIGAPPTGTTSGGNEAVTGSSIVQQQQNWIIQQAQAANQAQEIANNYAIGVAQVQAQYAQIAEQTQAAEANYAGQMAQIQAQYGEDVANFGLQKAQDLYQARLGQAQLALDSARAQQQNAALQLQVAQANAQQRQAQAAAYQNTLQMLANRTGPQDEVAYQRLVAGIGAPTPTNSTTLDPFAYIKSLYQPISIPDVPIPQVPSDLGASAIAAAQPPAPFTPPSFQFSAPPSAPSMSEPSINLPGISTGGTPPAAGSSSSGGGVVNYGPGAEPGMGSTPPYGGIGIPNQAVTSLQPGQSTTLETGTGGPFSTSTLAPGYTVTYNGQNYTNASSPFQIPGGTQVQVGRNAYNTLQPYSGIGIPNQDVASLTQGQSENVTTGTGGAFNTNTLSPGYRVTYNGTPYTNANSYMIPGGSNVSVTRMDTGGEVGGGAVALVGDGPGKQPSKNAELAQALVDKVTGQPVLRVTPPAQTQQIINSSGLPMPGIGGMTIPRADSGGTFGSTQPGVENPNAGVAGSVTNTPPDYGGNGSNGTYGTQLNYPTMTFNGYGPGVLGSQPFYQQLQGLAPSRPFGGFGATISNPQLGIQNAPVGINARTYNYLLPSQQQAFQSLYGQGLGINPADIIQQAQNAAPQGMYYGYVPLVASHYG